MPRFSTRTIAIVRQMSNEMLTQTCTLYRRTDATGQMGEPLNTFELVATGVRCRVIRAKVPSNSTAQPVGSQNAMTDTMRLECDYDTSLEAEMRSEIDDGSLWDVVSIEDKLSDSVFAAAVITRVRT